MANSVHPARGVSLGMQLFRKVLFPVDMSDACTATAPFVDAMVRHFQAELTLLHVMDFGASIADWDSYMSLPDAESVRGTWRDAFNRYLGDKFEGLKLERVVVEGDPAREIVSKARELEADLIMLPTHGYGLFRSLLLGSVTAKVLHDVTCPVWTGVHMEVIPQRLAKLENVLCAVDLTESSIPLMQFASSFAREFQARLWLVHAVPALESMPQKYFDTDLHADLEKDARQTIGNMQEKAGVVAQLCLARGEVANVVRDAALHHAAGLVVTGRGAATEAFGRLRTQIYSIIRQSPCPVISL